MIGFQKNCLAVCSARGVGQRNHDVGASGIAQPRWCHQRMQLPVGGIGNYATNPKSKDVYGGFRKNGGTPSHHPFLDGIFPTKNQPFWGTPMAIETSSCVFLSPWELVALGHQARDHWWRYSHPSWTRSRCPVISEGQSLGPMIFTHRKKYTFIILYQPEKSVATDLEYLDVDSWRIAPVPGHLCAWWPPRQGQQYLPHWSPLDLSSALMENDGESWGASHSGVCLETSASCIPNRKGWQGLTQSRRWRCTISIQFTHRSQAASSASEELVDCHLNLRGGWLI